MSDSTKSKNSVARAKKPKSFLSSFSSSVALSGADTGPRPQFKSPLSRFVFGLRPPFARPIRFSLRLSTRVSTPIDTVVSKLPCQPPTVKSVAPAGPHATNSPSALDPSNTPRNPLAISHPPWPERVQPRPNVLSSVSTASKPALCRSRTPLQPFRRAWRPASILVHGLRLAADRIGVDERHHQFRPETPQRRPADRIARQHVLHRHAAQHVDRQRRDIGRPLLPRVLPGAAPCIAQAVDQPGEHRLQASPEVGLGPAGHGHLEQHVAIAALVETLPDLLDQAAVMPPLGTLCRKLVRGAPRVGDHHLGRRRDQLVARGEMMRPGTLGNRGPFQDPRQAGAVKPEFLQAVERRVDQQIAGLTTSLLLVAH